MVPNVEVVFHSKHCSQFSRTINNQRTNGKKKSPFTSHAYASLRNRWITQNKQDQRQKHARYLRIVRWRTTWLVIRCLFCPAYSWAGYCCLACIPRGSFRWSGQSRIWVGRAVQVRRGHTEEHRFLDDVNEHQAAIVSVSHSAQK